MKENGKEKISMSAEIFLDSNILVYAYDTHDAKKQKTAVDIIKKAIEEESGMVSAQVLGEFFVVVTRKIEAPLSVADAETIIDILSALPVAEIDLPLVRRAISTQKACKISYWDALIVAAAEREGCSVIFSEDLNDGQEYNGVRVRNPFKADPVKTDPADC